MQETRTTNSTLERIIDTVGELPASPAIVSTVMGLTSNLDSKIGDVSKVLSADQSLTAKVLKLSNSSFFGRAKDVRTLQEAILILGFFTVRSMVIATSAHSMYNQGDDDIGWQTKLWQHSLSSAVAARQIAQHVRHPAKDELFIAALLHDIGKLVLFQKLPQRYSEVLEEVESTNGSFIEVEDRVIGFNHCDVATVLLKKWSFPESLTSMVSIHHNPASGEDNGIVSPAQVVNLANHMAKKLNVGFNDGQIENLAELESAKVMSLEEDTLETIFEQLEEFYQAELRILDES